MAFPKRKAITDLGNESMGFNLPNRAFVQRARQAEQNGSPNDTGIETAAVMQALTAKAGKRGKKKGR